MTLHEVMQIVERRRFDEGGLEVGHERFFG